MSPTLNGLLVWMETDHRISVNDWTLQDGITTSLGSFLQLRDDGLAEEQAEGRQLLVHWKAIADLSVDQLQSMGLPDACPYTLEITTNSSLRDANFEINYGFVLKGRRVLGADRTGAWLSIKSDSVILINPLYDLVEAIDDLNSERGQDLETRMLKWGQISEQLPDDALIPPHLHSIKVTVATGFKLYPFINELGEPDFDPVLGRWETHPTEDIDEKKEFKPSLPNARQSDFANKFRELNQVKHRYAVGGNNFVVLIPDVEKALNSVHIAQRSSTEDRRSFLKNVSGHIRCTLDDAGEPDVSVDQIFCDQELSDRVIGIWDRRPLPWIKQASEPWLPAEKLGLRIGTTIVQLVESELPTLLTRVKDAIKSGVETIRTEDGTVIPVQENTLSAIKNLIRSVPSLQSPSPNSTSPDQKIQPNNDKHDQVLLVKENLQSLEFQSGKRSRTSGIVQLTPKLDSTLLPHQIVAFEWLLKHWEVGSWGCLLADDMGLGKTLEALAFLSCLQSHLRDHGINNRPILVVAPTGLLRNWQVEHSKHLSGNGLGHAIEAHGIGLRQLRMHTSSAGNELRHDMGLPKLDISRLKKSPWVLTTYETLRDYQHSFGRIHWSACIFDEAQKIKNPNAQVTVAALAMNIDFALLMTGTPVENRAADLWSLLERVEPGMFETLREFSKKHESNDKDAKLALEELNHALTHGNGVPQLMLRRLKKDHITGLPTKHVHERIVEMPPSQAVQYENVVKRGRNTDEAMLHTLQRLRSISLHPEAPGNSSDEEYISQSARLSETFSILQEISKSDQKALIFVESREMQGFLISALRRYFQLPEDVLVINGQVPGKTRQARVDIFQNRKGFDVMLLSPRAGGVGLTLTAANHVIHLSRWWNPAVEDQCTDRVFRIGQKQPVHIYIPMAKHPRFNSSSFDLKLNDLISRKRELNYRILTPTSVNNDEMKELYRSTISGDETGQYLHKEEINVDLLDPVAFEEWVLEQLSTVCYEICRTPKSGDHGADGLAYFRANGKQYTIVIQCKRLQSGAKCDHRAVEQVLNAISAYEIRGKAKPMVVTTGKGFTRRAQNLARHKGVIMVSRSNLDQLQSWKPL